MKSDVVKTGIQQVPHRSLLNTLNMTEEEMRKPLVGIVSSYNETVPGHMSLDEIVDAVKLGVTMAGDIPVVFPVITVCDGITMGHTGMKYSLMTRDSIVDSTEYIALVHRSDALVMVPNYDKNVPGLLMTTTRINVLTMFVSDGPILTDHVRGHKTNLSSTFKAVGAYAAGNMSEGDVKESESRAYPTCSSRSGMYTTNNMNCLTEVLGMGLKGDGTVPAVYSERIKLARYAGMKVMEMYERNIRLKDIMTKEASMNTLTMDMAPGYSINSMLHLPAIAHEAGVELSVDITNEISAKTPSLYHPMPAGSTYVGNLNEAGGIYVVMKEISKKRFLNLDCMTAIDKTVGGNIEDYVNRNLEVIRPMENPYSQTGGIAMLKGNLAPDSAVVKHFVAAPEVLKHEGPTRALDCEEDVIDVIKNGRVVTEDVVVIRYEGPKGGSDMREMLNPISVIAGIGLGSTVVLVTDGRFFGASRGASIGHASPEAAVGGLIALMEEGDIISTDTDNHGLNVLVSDQEMEARKAK